MGGAARLKQSFSLGLSILLIFTIGPAAPTAMAYQTAATAPAGSTTSAYSGQGVPATAEELQAIVAPIALYPDALVAQILTAATFPDQIAIAAYWVEQNKSLTGSALVSAVNAQTWDPSVKALTQFPSVLSNMSQNLSWTSQLGEDYHNQQADVMTAIQTLRAKAKSAGNLKTTPQVTVVQQSPQVIVIQPTNPASRLRSHLQPRNRLRLPLRRPCVRLRSSSQHRRCGRCRPHRLRRGNRCRCNDVQQLGI